jgi:NAD(P)-dependent dehydrogenase (short-subunit alcohol dehydrogenase family)
MPFEGTTAIVTGGASGIGLAIVDALVERGTKVAKFDIQQETLARAAERLRADGATVSGHRVDVSNRQQIEDAVTRVREEFGPVLILVNSAGIEQFGGFAKITDELWNQVMAINLRGPFMCSQAVLPDMKAANWGRIVHISSSSAQSGQPYMAAYVSSKAGLIGLTKSMALELGPRGITVNTIPPGMIVTPMVDRAVAEGRFTDPVEHFASITPVRRAGEPEDIANAAVFLCADESSYITGQVIGVNGGRNT